MATGWWVSIIHPDKHCVLTFKNICTTTFCSIYEKTPLEMVWVKKIFFGLAPPPPEKFSFMASGLMSTSIMINTVCSHIEKHLYNNKTYFCTAKSDVWSARRNTFPPTGPRWASARCCCAPRRTALRVRAPSMRTRSRWSTTREVNAQKCFFSAQISFDFYIFIFMFC